MTTQSQAKARALDAFKRGKSTLLNGSVQCYNIPLQHVPVIEAALAPSHVAAQGDVDSKMQEVIANYLKGHSLANMQDEFGNGYPLIDALTAENHTIDEGKEECDYIANMLAADIFDVFPVLQSATNPDKAREVTVSVDEDEVFRYMMQQEGFKQVNSLRWPEAIKHFIDYLKENNLRIVKGGA